MRTPRFPRSSQVQYTGLPTAVYYGYTYDSLGNIATYSAPGKGTVTYTYDAMGQLLSTVGDETYAYTYDSADNILTANGHTYTYGDTGWKDLLTAYDGQTITYDAIGNPYRYYNGTRWNFNWKDGRRLAFASNGTTSIHYDYDANGLRTGKTVGSVSHHYLYDDGQLMRETYGSNTLDFFYDTNGYPYALKYNGTAYYYITNLQGDVMCLVDAQGNTVASYDYDPYGNIISATGAMAEINPLRYRGYYYDTELEMYYLQSRYYDPQIGRFINADTQFDENAGICGYNLFAYCANNPIMYKDESGQSISLLACVIIGAVVGAVVGAVASKMIYGKVNGWWVLGGAVVGGVLGYVGGAFFGASGIKAGTLASKISMSKVRWLGKIGEKISKLPKNTKHIPSLSNSAKYRIPDYLDDANKIIGDVKNVKQLSYTKQLKDFMLYADKYGYTFVLKVRKTTQLSSTLKSLVDAGKIVLLYL